MNSDGPRLHPREKITRAARLSLQKKILDWMGEEGTNELTHIEYLQIVSGELGDTLSSSLKFALRDERHNSRNKPAGWE